MGKSTELGMSVCSPKTKIILIGNMGDIKLAGRKQNLNLMHKKMMNICRHCRTYILVLTTCIEDALNVNVNRTKLFLRNTKKCWNYVFPLKQLKNTRVEKNLTQRRLSVSTTWKDMLKNASRDIVNWRTKRQSS